MNLTTQGAGSREKLATFTPEKRLLATRLLLKQRLAATSDLPEIRPAPERKVYPATQAQKNFFVLHHRAASKTAYNMPLAFSLPREIDGDRVEDALNALVGQHEALRTRFEVKAGELCQIIDPFALLELEVEEVPELGAAGFQEFVRPFDLSRSPLLRCKLFVQEEALRNVIILDMHHIIADDWAVRILVDDLAALLRGRPAQPSPARLRDFAVWESEHYLTSQRFAAELGYWRHRLQNWSGVIDFSCATRLPVARTAGHGMETITWRERDAQRIREFCLAQRATRFSFMCCALTLALHGWTGVRDITIGTVTTLRDVGDFGRTIGCFVNDVVIRNQLQPGDGLREIWEMVRRSVGEAMAHKACPFVRVVEEVRAGGRSTHNVIYTQSTEREAGEDAAGWITPWSGTYGAMPTSFDLFVTSAESASEITVKFFHRRDSIDPEQLQSFTKLFADTANELLALSRGAR